MATDDERFLDRPENAARRAAAWSAASDYLSNFGPTLLDVADSVLVAVEEIDLDDAYPEDAAAEAADGAVPIYTHEIMAAASESAEIFAGPDDSGLVAEDATPEQTITAAIYEFASSIAHNRLWERIEERQEIEDDHEAALDEYAIVREARRFVDEAAAAWYAEAAS